MRGELFALLTLAVTFVLATIVLNTPIDGYYARLRLDDLARLSTSPRRAAAFIVTADHRAPGLDRLDLRARLVRPPEQLSLFA